MSRHPVTMHMCLVLFSLSALCQHVRAASDADASGRQAEAIQQKQQQQIQQGQQDVRPSVSPDGVNLRAIDPKFLKPPKAINACYDIHRIEIQYARHLAPEITSRINRQFAGRCLGSEEITEILSLITRSYIDQGFVTTRAYLNTQGLESGVLHIAVLEGIIRHFQIDDKNSHSVSINNIYPGMDGKILNIRDLEQGLDQLNRLQSNNAQVDIRPGDVPGESLVVIHNETKFPVHLLTTFDNQGLTGTGRDQAAATITEDNVLGFNESVALTHRQSFPANDQLHYADSTDVNIVLPMGYSTLMMDANRSAYIDMLTTPADVLLPAEGFNSVNTLALDRLVYRDQSTRLSFSVGLTTKDSHNFLANQLLTVSSLNLTDLNLKASLSAAVNKKSVFMLDFSYTRGLAAMGALQDAADLPSDEAHAQFQKIMANGRLKMPFDLLGQRFDYESTLTTQHAFNPLYGAEQLLIGGIYTVRGFMNNTLTGDNGYYWRNDLSLAKQFAMGNQTINGKVFVGLDAGHVSNLASGVPDGSLAGATVGLSAQWQGLTWDLFRSAPVSEPATMMREPAQFWLRLSASL